MDVKIYDFDGIQKDWAWLVSVFGPKLKILSVETKFPLKVGEHIYKVDTIRAKRGYSSCLIQVRNLDGTPVPGKTVVWGWSGAPSHELANKGWNWTTIGVPGKTNETGDVGPGMGTGAYYHPDDPNDDMGPHWCWVYDLPSDYVEGIGMLSMTVHDHPDIGYREVVYQGEEEPPVNGELLGAVKNLDKNVAAILEWIKGGTPPPPPPPADTDFEGQYFNNTTLSGTPVLTRADKAINFDWGTAGPGSGVTADNFSVRWTAKKTFGAGNYKFTMRVDDGGRLYVDGVRILDAWKDQAATTYTAAIALAAGQHTIMMEHYEKGGLAVASLSWEKQ